MNGSNRIAGFHYQKNQKKFTISGNSEAGIGLDVVLRDGLLPVAWNSLDKVSCNSSYDRWD